MPIRTSIGCLPLVLAMALAGCQSVSSPSPAPSVVQQPAPLPTPPVFPPGVLSDYTLSGVVFEVTATGQTPIEGVEVYCELCGAATHSWTSTDSNGFYRFIGVWTTIDVSTEVWFGKEGYTYPPASNASGPRHVLITGDTRFDVELVSRYSVATFSAGRSGRHGNSGANDRTRGNSRPV